MSEPFTDLLEEWLDGTLSGERAAAFAALLSADPQRLEEARVALRLRRLLPLALREGAGTADAFTAAVLHEIRPITRRFAVRTMASLHGPRRRGARGPRHAVPWAAGVTLAAGVLVALFLLVGREPASAPAAIVAQTVTGPVEVVTASGSWRAVDAGAELRAGTRLRTRDRASLRTAAGSVIQLAAGTEIALGTGTGAVAPRLLLASGACFIATGPADRGLVVATGSGDARAIGTRFGVEITDGAAVVGVVEGAVEATGAGLSLRIPAGRCGRLDGQAVLLDDLDPSARFAWATGAGGNQPDPLINLALLPQARLSGSVSPGTDRGSLREILFDPAAGDYVESTTYNEYGLDFAADLGVVDERDPFHWTVEWPQAMNINRITVGGSYINQPQPTTAWAIRYRVDGRWLDLARGVGGWIDGGIFAWGGLDQRPIVADALQVALFSFDGQLLRSAHLRARGGQSHHGDDRSQIIKATLIQYLPPR